MNFASAVDDAGEEEHFATRQSLFSVDESYYQQFVSYTDFTDPSRPPIIVWPPVQRYKVLDVLPALSLGKTNEGINIYGANLECQKAIDVVAIIEWLQSYGLTADKKHKSSESHVLIYIKSSICSRPESYEIQIRQNRVVIVGADYVGVIYALNCFKALIMNNGRVSFENDHKCVSLPALLLSDHPTIPRRGVIWSFQHHVYSSKTNSATNIRLLSNLRINTILLLFDVVIDLYPAGSDVLGQIGEDLSGYLEVAANYAIDLLPMIIVKNNNDDHHKVKANLVKGLFPGRKVVVLFDLSAGESDAASAVASARLLYEQVLMDLSDSDLKGIAVILSDQTRLLLGDDDHQQPTTIPFEQSNYIKPIEQWPYSALGLSAAKRKPLVIMTNIIQAVANHVRDICEQDIQLAFLPLHSDRDYLSPDVTSKFLLSMFACCASFGPGLSSSLFDGPHLPRYLRPVAHLILPNQERDMQLLRETLMSLLNWKKATPFMPSSSPSSSLSISSSPPMTSSPKHSTSSHSSRLALAEQSMWSLYLMSDDLQPHELPSAEEALALYRLYCGLLSTAQFKPAQLKRVQGRAARLRGSHPTINEIEEFFLAIDSLAMLSRSLYLAASIAAASNGGGQDGDDDSGEVAAAAMATILAATPSSNNNKSNNFSMGPGQQPSANNNNNISNTSSVATIISSAAYGNKRAAVYDNVDMSKPYRPKIVPKTIDIARMLTRVVQQNVLFRSFKSEEHASIVEAFECVHAKAGEIVIKQGDAGEYFYIVEAGRLDVYMESCGVRIKVGRSLAAGDYFGELALMYNTPRAATVISTEPSTLWRIDRATYRSIVTYHHKVTSDEFFDLVSNVMILGKRLGDVLSPAELSKVVSTVEIEEFAAGSMIIRQHQTGDYFYIISEGIVDVRQETINSSSSGIAGAINNNSNINSSSSLPSPPPPAQRRKSLGNRVATLSRGDCFGEKALLADDVRQASCVAVGRVVCLSLSRDDFISMIGSWQDVTDVAHLQKLAVRRARVRASVYDAQYMHTVELADLDRLAVLGEGAFGRVVAVRHKQSQKLYALKIQAKAFITAQKMQESVANEAAVMRQVDHPFISKLHATLQDNKFVYFLLELLPGGEFFAFLQAAGKLGEEQARFYSASVVLALEELHKAKIAYRDLKPENMVLDSKGYVKLVDFGLAKQIVVGGLTWTMCGTPDYLAPEIILNKGHNHAVDYWALGVLVYEILHGWPAFYHEQPMKVYEKIIMAKVSYPSSFSKPLEDIISKFLVTNPSKRLGNVKGGIADISKHKWFGSFDWRGLANGSLSAPLLPDLSAFENKISAVNAASTEAALYSFASEVDESDWNAEL